MLKDKSVSREEFSRIQDELDKKEEQIQRLNEVKDLFFEISGTEAIASEIKGSPEEKLNPTSLDNKSLDELNEIKRELELAKENKNKSVPSNNMVLFVVMNSAALRLIPTTVAGIRANHNSQNPLEILVPSIITSFCALTVGILMAKLLERYFKYE